MENVEYTDLFKTVRDMTPANKLVYVLRRQDILPAIYGLAVKSHRHETYLAKQTRARRYEIYLKEMRKKRYAIAFRPIGKLVFKQAEKIQDWSIASAMARTEHLVEIRLPWLDQKAKHFHFQNQMAAEIWTQVVANNMIKPDVLLELNTIQGLLELRQG